VRIRPPGSLRLLLPLSLITLAFVTESIFLLKELDAIPERVTLEMIEDAREIAAPVQGNLNRFYRLGDPTGIEANLAWTSTHPKSIGAAVVTADGRVVAGTQIAWKEHSAEQVLPSGLLLPCYEPPHVGAVAVAEADPDIVLARYPIRLAPPATDGTLLMGFDRSVPITQAKRETWGHFAWYMLILTSFAAFVGVLLNRLVSDRAVALVRQARAIAAGDFTARTALEGRDELGILGQALDHMADKLARMSEDLRRTTALLSGVIDGTADAVFAKDRDGKYLLFNTAAAAFTGKRVEEVLGKDDTAIFNSPDAEVVMAHDRQVIETGKMVLIDERITAAGVTRTYQALKSPLRDEEGRVIGIIGVSRDITDRVETERRYQVLSEMSPVGVFRGDAHGRCLYVNPRWSAITGISVEEAIGDDWMKVLLDGKKEPLPRWIAGATSEERDSLTGDSHTQRLLLCVVPADGMYRWVISQISPERDEGGSVTGWIGTFTDITAQKRAEAEIQALNADLERRVAERTEELGRANTALARAARLKDEFLANMSHELRTPLNGVLGFAQTLQEGVYGDLSSAQASAVHDIEQCGRHLLSLINDILDLSKVEAGEVKLEFAVTSVQSLCNTSLRMIRELAQKKNIQLASHIDESLSVFVADERRLKQILVNLLGNAVKFTPQGGHVTLSVKLAQDGRTIEFAVIDTGIGIRQEDMGLLFRPFQQIDSKLSREFEGTGLGLALVSRLAGLHGGAVSVESQVGVGSVFTVRLPFHGLETHDLTESGRQWTSPAFLAEGAEQPLEEKRLAQAARRPLVLLVEDNDASARTVRDYLYAAGYSVMIASDGQRTIEMARAQQPVVILMDIQMPGMDGLEATAQLRRDSATKDIPIVAVTALAMAGDKERCLEAGADEYLSKPLDFGALRAILYRCTQRRGWAEAKPITA